MSTGQSNELPQRSGTFRAVVQSGSTITSYLRAGVGRPVVLLSRTAPDGVVPTSLIRTLGTSFRVLVPELPEQGEQFVEWFGPFLDGLGLTEVAVIVDDELAAPLMDIARTEPGRISRILLLSPDGCRPSSTNGLSQPLLCACIGCSVDELVTQAAWFLAGAPDHLDSGNG